MPAHDTASIGSRTLCDKLYAALMQRIPRLQRSMTKQWCALYETGGTRFAYIAHRKTSNSLEIWCSGDVDSLIKNSYMKVVPRSKIGAGWEDRFPARFKVDNETQIESAADLLYFISYKNG